MDGPMKRSLRLFIVVGVVLLLVGATLYSACAALGHSLPDSPSSSFERTDPWSSGDAAAHDLLILSIAGAFTGWLAMMFVARSHRRHTVLNCRHCGHGTRIDDRACAHCGSRWA